MSIIVDHPYNTEPLNQKPSHTRNLVLVMYAGGKHLTRKNLRTARGGTAYGEDIAVGLLQCVTLPNGIKVDADVV